MGLFRLVARVGRWRRRATFVLEEWSPILAASGDDRTRLTGPLAIFRHCERPASTSSLRATSVRSDGQADAIRRLGISPLAPLRRQGPRGGARPPVRPRRLQRARRPAGAQGAEQPRALDVLRGPRRRVQQELELFRRPDRRGSGQARRGGGKRRLGLSPERALRNGPGRATAAAAATRCARSTRWSWKPTPTSRRSRPAIAAWPRNIIPTATRATRKRPSASTRSRPPMTCCAGPKSGRPAPRL